MASDQHILIIDDEIIFARAVNKQLARAGYQCRIAGDMATSRAVLKEHNFDLILLDLRLPDGSGLDLLLELKGGEYADIAVIVMSAHGEIDDAVMAIKNGAADYLKKPIDLQELLLKIDTVLARDKLQTKLLYSNKREHRAGESVELMGDCPAILLIKQQIRQIAELTRAADQAPPTVLITGETGTGKDIAARLLHAHSDHSDRPFVQIDCGSLPGEIIESELFGHEKGSFTSAHSAHAGLIEAAEDGTLFIDEIGELPVNLQPKLLAVLERRLLRRLGATREFSTSAWFIAATNRQLQLLVEEGRFRSDLYYRLNVIHIHMPPLRERGDDLIKLAGHFAAQTARRYGFAAASISAAAQRAISAYPWPGNVREMKHLVERSVLLNSGGELNPAVLGLGDAGGGAGLGDQHDQSAPVEAAGMTLDQAEQRLIKEALLNSGGNVSKAARELGITRMALRYRMQKYKLSERP